MSKPESPSQNGSVFELPVLPLAGFDKNQGVGSGYLYLPLLASQVARLSPEDCPAK